MARRLVFIPGPAHEGRDARSLQDSWVASLGRGLAKSNLRIPITATDIRLPCYRDSLAGRLAGNPEEQVANILIEGRHASPGEPGFMLAVLTQVARAHGITDAEIHAVADTAVQSWEAVHGVLRVLASRLGAASAAASAISARDVFRYLFDSAIADAIDNGAHAAMRGSSSAVVVSHSLGTVVAYMVLNEIAPRAGWHVPLFVTLGSPLAVTAIRRRLMPLRYPACVGKWVNAMDPRDVVSLYPLYGASFPVEPKIENKTDVENFTDDHHGIEGYLEDPVVAHRIHDALASTKSASVLALGQSDARR